MVEKQKARSVLASWREIISFHQRAGVSVDRCSDDPRWYRLDTNRHPLAGRPVRGRTLSRIILQLGFYRHKGCLLLLCGDDHRRR